MASFSADEKASKKYVQENGTLTNKLGITDKKILETVEAFIVEKSIKEKGLSDKAKEVSKEGLKAMHKEMFEEVYEWAGTFRDYTTGRGLPFCKPEFIDKELDKQYKKVCEDLSSSMLHEKFAEITGEFMGELNVIHSFVDGNGRTQRQTLVNLASIADKTIDVSLLNKKDWYKAAEISHITGDNSAFVQIIYQALL